MNSDQQSTFTLHANKEHAGVRFVVIFILAITFLIIFIGMNGIVSSSNSLIADFALVIPCLIALPVSLGLAAITERFLKGNWPSGQRVEMSEQNAVVYQLDGGTAEIDWSARFTILKWYLGFRGYALGGRERRLPKNHVCLALQLQQDNHRFVIHSFLPLSVATPIIEDNKFREIKPADYYEGGFLRRWIGSTERPKIPSSVLAGRDGPYWMAERRRWTEGLELEKRDFQLFLELVEKKFVQWDDLGPD